MEKILFKNYPDTTTPINAENLNTMQNNAEASIIEVDTKNTNLKNQVANGWYEIDSTAVLTFSSWDASVYTGAVSTNIDLTSVLSVGMKIKLTQNGVVKYGFITAITSNSITLYGGTDYTLSDTAITKVYYSNTKAPFGFPLNPDKWSVIVTNTSDGSQSSPNGGIWYNLGGTALTIPIGLWNLGYKVTAQNGSCITSSVNRVISVTLSTGNTNNSNPEFIMQSGIVGSYIRNVFEKTELKSITSKQTWYLNTMSDTTIDIIYNLGEGKPTQIIAVCAYL